jgi:glycosyltransferase involved in cell wall biosynthesis
LAFHPTTSENLAKSENRLLKLARLAIFSSQTLAERVSQRSNVGHMEIVNNGVNDALIQFAFDFKRVENVEAKDIIFGYFGTISHWFDWPLVLKILETMPHARIRLAGPVETEIPQHPRIEYVGILPHAALMEFVTHCNALIMPFIVNRLIEAVDPVKLYEYIAYGLPTLAPRYSETERFVPWVQLYKNIDEAIEISNTLLISPENKGSKEQRLAFLESNSWNNRYKKISDAMSKL